MPVVLTVKKLKKFNEWWDALTPLEQNNLMVMLHNYPQRVREMPSDNPNKEFMLIGLEVIRRTPKHEEASVWTTTPR